MFEAVKRDGIARIGILSGVGSIVGCESAQEERRAQVEQTERAERTEQTDQIRYQTPIALDVDKLFPDISDERHRFTSVPLFASEKFTARYMPEYKDAVFKTPSSGNVAESGSMLVIANWQTVLDNPRYYADAVIKIKSGVPADTCMYAPASALPSNVCTLICSGFDLFDYRAVDLKSVQNIFCTQDGEFPAEEAFGRGICSCSGCKKGDLKEHNRNMLDNEIETVKYFIRTGHVRELLERRCRNTAAQVSIMRLFDENYEFSEKRTPIVRPTRLYANTGESMKRPEVKRFVNRVIERFVPSRTDVAVLIPCSAKKPYSQSQSHIKFQSAIQNRAHEIIITSPLGIVPRELERIYPAGHYDVPVTGYWDGEERAFITDAIARYFEKNRYEKVFVHLDGDSLGIAEAALKRAGIGYEVTASERLTSAESLKKLQDALQEYRKVSPDIIGGTVSYQFGATHENFDSSKLKLKGKFLREKVLRGNQQLFSVDTETGCFRPTFDGWELIESGYRVYIDNFVPQGDILAPGVSDCDRDIREGDEVLVVGENALATGKAMMGADEMLSSRRGVAVRVRKVKKL